jgi:hypothetical protein
MEVFMAPSRVRRLGRLLVVAAIAACSDNVTASNRRTLMWSRPRVPTGAVVPLASFIAPAGPSAATLVPLGVHDTSLTATRAAGTGVSARGRRAPAPQVFHNTGTTVSQGTNVQPLAADGVATLVRRVEQAGAAGNRPALLALAHPDIARTSLEDFATTLTTPRPTRLVVFERDRRTLSGGTVRIIIEVFVERGIEAQVGTWTLDLRPGEAARDPWQIVAVGRLSVVTGLYRLSLNTAKEYDVHNLTVHAPDLSIDMSAGRAFVAETPDGITAVVLLGRGTMTFTPPDPAEQTQLKIFSGSNALTAEIDMAFIRVAPGEFESRFAAAALKPRAVVPRDLRTAVSVFNDYIGRSLQIDLNDLSRDPWSLTPQWGDVIAEMRTKRFGTLTYARSGNEAEDITVFDRRRRRNISLYASAAKLAVRGRFYDEDTLTDYDVLTYDIDAEITPDRGLIAGTARLRVKIRNDGTSSLTFRLADSVVVRGVYSPEFGRLLHLRVVGQNSVIVNLPSRVAAATEMAIDVVYGGPIAPQSFEAEAVQVEQEPLESIGMPVERRFLYSNRSYWYPQAVVSDYATATLRITVPNEFDVVATGDPAGLPSPSPGTPEGQRRRKSYVFDASKPARYLAVLISRFTEVDSTRATVGTTDVSLHVQSNPRQVVRVRTMMGRAAAVLKYYGSLLGDAPYPSFTLALMESERPGGHSPPYFALLNQVAPTSRSVWRNDPVNFDKYPAFFLAHEIAHQWWGHAVGWKNYHEQWISEGLAQYFAALYAEQDPAGEALPNVLRQMRRTAIAAAADGPIYLGYRLGHIQGDDRVFRAVVYNKSAMVLHMLRRLVGDEAFFSGVRNFYREWKFRKAGTDDFRRAMETASGRDLNRFFEAWVYGTAIPRVKFSYHLDGPVALIRFEHEGPAVEVPITVTVTYTSGATQSTVMLLSDQVTERTVPLTGPVRSVTANDDNAALVVLAR